MEFGSWTLNPPPSFPIFSDKQLQAHKYPFWVIFVRHGKGSTGLDGCYKHKPFYRGQRSILTKRSPIPFPAFLKAKRVLFLRIGTAPLPKWLRFSWLPFQANQQNGFQPNRRHTHLGVLFLELVPFCFGLIKWTIKKGKPFSLLQNLSILEGSNDTKAHPFRCPCPLGFPVKGEPQPVFG